MDSANLHADVLEITTSDYYRSIYLKEIVLSTFGLGSHSIAVVEVLKYIEEQLKLYDFREFYGHIENYCDLHGGNQMAGAVPVLHTRLHLPLSNVQEHLQALGEASHRRGMIFDIKRSKRLDKAAADAITQDPEYHRPMRPTRVRLLPAERKFDPNQCQISVLTAGKKSAMSTIPIMFRSFEIVSRSSQASGVLVAPSAFDPVHTSPDDPFVNDALLAAVSMNRYSRVAMDNPAKDLLADAVAMYRMTPHRIQPTPEEQNLRPFGVVQTLISIGPLLAPRQQKKKHWWSRKPSETVSSTSSMDPLIELTRKNGIIYFLLHISGLEEVDPDDFSDENIRRAKRAAEESLIEPEQQRNIRVMVLQLVAARVLRAGLPLPNPETQPQAPISEMSANRSPIEVEGDIQPIRSTSSFPQRGGNFDGFVQSLRQTQSFPHSP